MKWILIAGIWFNPAQITDLHMWNDKCVIRTSADYRHAVNMSCKAVVALLKKHYDK